MLGHRIGDLKTSFQPMPIEMLPDPQGITKLFPLAGSVTHLSL